VCFVLKAFLTRICVCRGGYLILMESPPVDGPCRRVHRSGGPPPWAPAHGHRAKHTYYYYPGQYVYYDLSSRIYFYRSGGSWVSATALPPGIRIDVGKHDVLEMDSDTPYVYHQEVVKRYPPGQLKKQGKEKDRGKH